MARVEPNVGAAPAKAPRDLRRVVGRTVVGEPPLLAPEDREDVVGLLVARPALDHVELAGVMEADVQRPVAAFREAAERATPPRTDRPVAPVDRTDHITRQEGLPPGFR